MGAATRPLLLVGTAALFIGAVTAGCGDKGGGSESGKEAAKYMGGGPPGAARPGGGGQPATGGAGGAGQPATGTAPGGAPSGGASR
jgi:hypothetical protein